MTARVADPEPAHSGERTVARLLLLGGSVLPSFVTVLVVGFFIARQPAEPALDGWWHGVMTAVRHPLFDGLSQFLAVWGDSGLGFGVVPALLVVALVWSGRISAVPGFVVTGVVSFVVVQVAQALIDRTGPDILRLSDSGSYPAGHVANVANVAALAVFVGLVYRRVWIWATATGYVLAMAVSRTYLHANWISDSLAGIILGTTIAYAVFVLSTTPAAAALRERWRVRLILGSPSR